MLVTSRSEYLVIASVTLIHHNHNTVLWNAALTCPSLFARDLGSFELNVEVIDAHVCNCMALSSPIPKSDYSNIYTDQVSATSRRSSF